MIRSLSISNYALIDSLSISFHEGLSIITGQTGAGKSIIIGALQQLLGARTDRRADTERPGKRVIEAEFDMPDSLRPLLDELQIDPEESIIVRRETSETGRSRAFVNDTPVALKHLAAIGAHLVDIHSQDSNRLLLTPSARLDIIDAMAANAPLRQRYDAAFKAYMKVRADIRSLRTAMAENRENREFAMFRLEQLDALKPRAGELEQLEREAEVLADAEQMGEALGQAAAILDSDDASVCHLLARTRQTLSKINLSLLETPSDNAPLLQQRLENTAIELADIADTLSTLTSGLDADPRRLEHTEARISALYDAMRRFGVQTDAELARMHADLKATVFGEEDAGERLSALETEARTLAAALRDAADALTDSRLAAADTFSRLLVETAHTLGLPNLKFSAMVQKGKLNATGQDHVAFLCSFNKNSELKPVEDVASGGETSRLMLSIKAIIAGHMHLPAIIFDEVDTGVSGEIADRMGDMMRRMSADIQVIAITHLPQVAAKGAHHYVVYKTDTDTSTVTNIRLLSPAERETELAAMLAGSRVDDAALLNARSLLGNQDSQP